MARTPVGVDPVVPLPNAAGLEALTAVVLTVNVRTRTHSTVQLLTT